MSKQKILIADDDESIRNMIKKYFQKKGFEVISVVNGKEAVTEEENIKPDLVILDVEMPVMDGFEACRIIKEKRSGIEYIPIIFLSGILDEAVIIKGLELGADDYVRKPFESLELLNRARNLLKMKNFISQVDLLENMVFSLIKSIQARDFYTAVHSRHVSIISMAFALELGLPREEIELLRKASLLHDIGKIGVPDQILNKNGKLLPEEFERIKEHPAQGEEICRNLRLDQNVIDIIRHHHEKLDGSGYPDGLKGNQISKFVRIVTVADIIDALTTDRPYRKAKGNEIALSILEDEANTGKLDMSIVKFAETVIKNRGEK